MIELYGFTIRYDPDHNNSAIYYLGGQIAGLYNVDIDFIIGFICLWINTQSSEYNGPNAMEFKDKMESLKIEEGIE